MRYTLAAASVAFIGYIIYKANTGTAPYLMQLVQTTAHADKVAHFLLFGLLSFILNIVFLFKQIRLGKHRIYRGTLLVAIFMVVEEFSQHYVATRNFDLYDLLADFSGLVAKISRPGESL